MFNPRNSLVKFTSIFRLIIKKQEHNILLNPKFYSTNKPKVFVTRSGLPGEGITELKEKCDVEIYEKRSTIPRDELLKRVNGKDGLLCLLTDPIDKEVLDAAGDQLKVVSTVSVGYDHIDLKACKEKNIPVSNTPHVSVNCVAEWTVLHLIASGRRFVEASNAIKRGEWTCQWSPDWLVGKGLEDSVVGIVGMGRIGQCVMKRMFPFHVKKVLYFDIVHPIKEAEEMGGVYAEFEDLLKNSDFVVCMTNLSEETKNLFNKKTFDLMKSTAVFINTSRGGVVNEDDLYDVLKANKIRAASIDVTVQEPLPQNHKLTTLPNLTITPHLGGSEVTSLAKMANLAAENVLLGVYGKPLATPVTMPK